MLQLDLHHLYYLLIRFEGIGLPVGSLDIRLRATSRPTSYASLLAAKDRSDTLSLSSFTSAFSAVSKLSLGGSWWARVEPPLDLEVKYIYSAFTKLPALSLKENDLRLIAELADDPPLDNAVPMYAFKNLQTLEILGVDPRTLLGWDQLAESLRSLTIKRSGLEDVTHLLIDCVLDDQTRRERDQSASRSSSPRRPHPSRFSSGRFTRTSSLAVPSAVREDAEAERPEDDDASDSDIVPQLPRLKWRPLRHLSLSDNALTFFPSAPLSSLTSLTHLDLSSNLLVSVPSGLSALYNLVSLNLSDNMIDSVLGIYASLGQVLSINLSHNRLDSICGLERLLALERVDLQSNQISEPDEIGRLAILPNIAGVWIENNPMAQLDEQYRVRCFDLFAQENKSVLLDETGPSFLEARNMRVQLPGEHAAEARRRSVASPPIVAVGAGSESPSTPTASRFNTNATLHNSPMVVVNGSTTTPSSSHPDSRFSVSSPSSVLSGSSSHPHPHNHPHQPKKRKPRRLVDFDGAHTDGSHSDASSATHNNPSDTSPLGLQPKRSSRHRRGASESETGGFSRLGNGNGNGGGSSVLPSPPIPNETGTDMPIVSVQRKNKSGKKARGGHGRYATESHAGAGDHDDDVGHRVMSAATVLEGGEEEEGEDGLSSADAYKAKIDALRREVGDSWLKVLSQSGGVPPSLSPRGSSGA